MAETPAPKKRRVRRMVVEAPTPPTNDDISRFGLPLSTKPVPPPSTPAASSANACVLVDCLGVPVVVSSSRRCY